MKKMYQPQTAEFIVHNERLPYWEDLNKESYIEILSVDPVTDTQKRIQIKYDNSYIAFLFSDIFHAGVQYGMKSIIESQKKLRNVA